jgi:putative addiction module killer protein
MSGRLSHSRAGFRACVTGERGGASRRDRLQIGNPGDIRSLGGGLSEMRIDYGSGYRVYFVLRGQTLIILLAGGDKGTQERDIAAARELARTL